MSYKFLCVPSDAAGNPMYAIPVSSELRVGEGAPNANGPRTVLTYPIAGAEKILVAQMAYADVIAKLKQLAEVI